MKPFKLTLLIAFVINSKVLFGQILEIEKIRMNEKSVASVVFSQESDLPDLTSGSEFLREFHNVQNETTFKLIKSKTDNYGFSHQKYEQYYNGIRVDGGQYIIHDNGNGKIRKMNGNYNKVNLKSLVPSISETEALKIALRSVNAKTFSWQNDKLDSTISIQKGISSSYPIGELVILNRENSLLTWEFEITSINPYSSQIINIDTEFGMF